MLLECAKTGRHQIGSSVKGTRKRKRQPDQSSVAGEGGNLAIREMLERCESDPVMKERMDRAKL
jgi:hypothetical protein